MRRSLSLSVGLVVFSACRAPSSSAPEVLEVNLTGASAVQRTDAGLHYYFDAPEVPVVSVDAGAWSGKWDDEPPRRFEGSSVVLERRSEGVHALTLSTDRASRTVRVSFREPTSGVRDAFAAKARVDVVAARKDLESLPADQWPWGCVGLAREAPISERADAYTACAQGAADRGFITESISRRIAALHWARRLRQLSRARGLIEQLDAALQEFPDVRLASQFHYTQAVFFAETGELREAERVLRLAIDESARAHHPEEAVLYRAYAAVISSESGHHTDAVAEARALQGAVISALSPGDQLALRSNLAWVKVRAFAQQAGVSRRSGDGSKGATPTVGAPTRSAPSQVEASSVRDVRSSLADAATASGASGSLRDASQADASTGGSPLDVTKGVASGDAGAVTGGTPTRAGAAPVVDAGAVTGGTPTRAGAAPVVDARAVTGDTPPRAADAPVVDADALVVELTRLAADSLAEDEPLEASNTLSNLAWIELTRGRFAQATEAVKKARALAGDAQTVEVLFLDWLDGRLALAAGDGKTAVRAFEQMLLRDAQSVDRFADSAWRAHLGLAEARLLLKQRPQAEAALGEARRALSQQARAFEPSQRVAFLQDRRSAISNAVTAFVRAGRCELAWRLADDGQAWLARSFESDRRVRLAQLSREAREQFERDEEAWALEREALLSSAAPSLASVEELEQWKAQRAARLAQLRSRATKLAAALDALAPLRTRAAFEPKSLGADEALLEWFHTPEGDRLFVVRASGVSCPATTTAAPVLAGVKHVNLIDGGARLEPTFILTLLQSATVSFVPSAEWLTQPAALTKGTPLVIGDPRFDLPSARGEARGVAKSLSAQLLEGDAATLEAVLSAWAARPVLHFAGHGRLNASAPWEARLELAKGQMLDFELLLSRHPAPGLVVLSGCETGTALDAPADGIGLAEGFLAGGANQVLATTIEVRDDRARTFIERFYRLGGATDPTTAFRAAALESRAAGDSGWEEWKLFGKRTVGR